MEDRIQTGDCFCCTTISTAKDARLWPSATTAA